MSWFTVQISLIWRRIKRVIYPPGTTPLSWRVHGIIFLALVSNTLILTVKIMIHKIDEKSIFSKKVKFI